VVPSATVTLTQTGTGLVRSVTSDIQGEYLVQMEVGDATQTVTVEATPPQVDTTTGTQSQVINQTQMVELALNGRNAAELSLLVPGASPSPSGGGGSPTRAGQKSTPISRISGTG